MVRRQATPEPERTPRSQKRQQPASDDDDWIKEIHRAGRTSGPVLSVEGNLPPRLSTAANAAAPAPAAAPAAAAAKPAAAAAAPAAAATAFYALAVTPSTVGGAVDRSAISDYAAALKADGVTGVISGAFASESQLLSLEERRSVIAGWGAQGLTHIADVTSNSIADIANLSAHAKSAGAAVAVAVGVPAAYQPSSVADYGQFYVEVSRQVSDVPLVLVHDPSLLRGKKDSCRLSDIVKEVASRVANLKGFIYAGDNVFDFATAQALSKAFPQLTYMIHAHDGTMTAAALQGARTFASVHFSTVGPMLIKCISAAQKADGAALSKLQTLAASYFTLVGDVANDDPERTVAATKAIASFRLERDLGYVRPPGPRLTVHDVQRLRSGMEAFVAQYSASVKPSAAAATKIDLTPMPGFTGRLDDKIARRAEECGRKAGIRNILQFFPHLGKSWRGRLPGRDCNVAQYIDHTLLKPEGTETEITTLTNEARKHKFYAVCVNGSRVDQCVAELRGTSVQVAAVIGFPLGAMTIKAKAREAKELVQKGCSEIDMVMNVGAMKDGDLKYVYEDIKAVVDASQPAIVKVIFETCLLTADEIMDASILSVAAGAGFLKTATGFNKGGATPEAIDIMLAVAGNECEVKASGGVRTAEDALAYITAGVKRIGTSSGIAIVTGAQSAGGY